ncbi:MAG: DUF308 domain-containing protein [Bacilli bacterium]|nr:DUF308 domain-containing protein [Bacilli bacterium]
MIRKNKGFKIGVLLAIAIASLIMVILAIVNLTKKGEGVVETLPFQIIISVILIAAAITSTALAVIENPKHFDVKLIGMNGVLLGLGIFVVLPAAHRMAEETIAYFVPSIIVGIGVFLIVATIISLVNKINKKDTDVIGMIIGIVMTVLGILLLVFAEKIIKVVWLIIGLLLLIYSIIEIIKVIKGKKEIKEINSSK